MTHADRRPNGRMDGLYEANKRFSRFKRWRLKMKECLKECHVTRVTEHFVRQVLETMQWRDVWQLHDYYELY